MSMTCLYFLIVKMTELNHQQVFNFAKGYRFQFEPVQDAYVLLYPEGLIKLNQTAGLILSKIDGQRTLGEIIADLNSQFPDADIRADVEAFFSEAMTNRWLECRS